MADQNGRERADIETGTAIFARYERKVCTIVDIYNALAINAAEIAADSENVADDAVAARKGSPAITPGKPEKSELVSRIMATDPDEVMPPPKTKKKLTPQQMELLKNWVAQGAEYLLIFSTGNGSRTCSASGTKPASTTRT